MEPELHVAAVKGNVSSLRDLLRNDAQRLDRVTTPETPLHIAAMLGHLDFVEEVLARKAEWATQQDSQGSTPLHLAAAKGYLNIVTSLLRVNPDICIVRDRYQRNPLHVAAMKGQVDVLEYLVRVRREAAESVVEDDQTILHLCVMHNRLEALKLLIDILRNDLFINSKDRHGNTILHLAAANGETKTMLFLTNKGVNPKFKNSRGYRALDLLAKGKSEERKREWQKDMHSTLMVVAILLATMAFQASITPPGGLWQEDSPADANTEKRSAGDANTKRHFAGEAILADKNPDDYNGFLICNTISFIASLSIIMLFISGLPLKRRRITTWIAMLTMWVAITFAAATYATSIFDFTPQSQQSTSLKSIGMAVNAWVGLMFLIFLCHIVRLILKLIRKVRQCICEDSNI